MSLGVGIIGVGVMGADHARILQTSVAGASVVAIADADHPRAVRVAKNVGARRTHADPLDLIRDPEVGAVLVASSNQTHTEFVLACLEKGKPVLCEKPLAESSEECLRIVAAETKLRRRLVQVGFMRRFDPDYVAMKRTLTEGTLGQALFLHCVHRNAESQPFVTSDMLINTAAIHEIDIARWLLDQEIVRATVMLPRPANPGGLIDPQFLILETERGILVDVEVFINARYGYDVSAELVCQSGTVTLPPPAGVYVRSAGQNAHGFAPDWRARFAEAYRIELQAWVDSIASGKPTGASAWDGYASIQVADAGIESLHGRAPVAVSLAARPALYA